MRRPDPGRRPYLGYRDGDFETPFARFFDPTMAPLAPDVVSALDEGPQAPKLLTELDAVGALLENDESTENGYALCRDGSVRIAVHTPMRGVTPEMWDWWFGWHGSDSRRYKLWHPRAHMYAQWADGDDAGRTGRERYVGRTSFVDEYLGSTLVRAAIRFVVPAEFGFDEGKLDPGRQTAICARVGSSERPVDIGYLVHHVRATDGGAEMRSRFWIGGTHIEARAQGATVGKAVAAVGRRVFTPTETNARELLVHCAKEMAHLAARLPLLYDELGQT